MTQTSGKTGLGERGGRGVPEGLWGVGGGWLIPLLRKWRLRAWGNPAEFLSVITRNGRPSGAGGECQLDLPGARLGSQTWPLSLLKPENPSAQGR